MNQLACIEDADAAFGEQLAVVYKHSTTCWISAAAIEEIERFVQRHPEVPVYVVDVHAAGPVSEYVMRRTGIRHASPQAIVFARGEPRWHASHFQVTAAAIERECGAGPG